MQHVTVCRGASETIQAAAQDLNNRAFRQHAALIVVQCRKTKNILVVKRYKDDQIGLPCGKVDPGETPIEAAYRELFEETGVTQRELLSPMRYIAAIMLDGTLVHVFETSRNHEAGIGAAPGFEKETLPHWMPVADLVATESRFQSFNIIALHKAGII